MKRKTSILVTYISHSWFLKGAESALVMLAILIIGLTAVWVEGAPASQTTSYDLTGTWNIDANGSKGTIDITEQSGNEFTGTVHIDSGRTESLINGRIIGNTITFTRMWDGQSLHQDYTGTLTIDANGTANMRGTFTQNDAGSYSSWSASKSMPASAAETSVWNTNWNEMTLHQEGAVITGSYAHDGGKSPEPWRETSSSVGGEKRETRKDAVLMVSGAAP